MIGLWSDLLSRVVLVERVGYWSVWYFEGIVYFGFWCTLDLIVTFVELNLTRKQLYVNWHRDRIYFLCLANKRLFTWRPGKYKIFIMNFRPYKFYSHGRWGNRHFDAKQQAA